MNDQSKNSPLVNEALKNGAVPDGFEPVEDIEFFQFKEIGDHITGRLIIKSTTRISGTPVGKYTVQVMENGMVKKVAFLGSMLLDEKLATIPNGSNIYVAFTSEEATGQAGNKMKHFTVATKKSS